MKNILKLEIKKAINNKFFICTVAAGCFITLFNVIHMVDLYYQDLENLSNAVDVSGYNINPITPASTVFNFWIGGEQQSVAFSLFFFLIPLMATIPYGWSYITERNSGYEKNMIIRTGRIPYFLSKYIAIFISGGLAVFIPLLFNFLTIALFIPSVTPDVSYDMFYAVYDGHLWSDIFYSHPFIFVSLYLILDFVFCGLISTISLAISYFIKNRFAVIIIPCFIILFIHYARYLLYSKVYIQISPIYFLHSTAVENNAVWWVVLLEALVLFICTFSITLVWGHKHEIY